MTQAAIKLRPGKHVVTQIGTEWHVLFQPEDLPYHYLSVGRFQDRGRAENYADLEHTMLADGIIEHKSATLPKDYWYAQEADIGGMKPIAAPVLESQSVAASPAIDAPRTDGAQGEAADPVVSPLIAEPEKLISESKEAAHRNSSDAPPPLPKPLAPSGEAASGDDEGGTSLALSAAPIDPGAQVPAPVEKQFPHSASHGEVIPEIASPPPSQSCAGEPSPAQEREAAVANPAASRPSLQSKKAAEKRERVYQAMLRARRPDGTVKMAMSTMAAQANVRLGDVGYCLTKLIEERRIDLVARATKIDCAVYRIISNLIPSESNEVESRRIKSIEGRGADAVASRQPAAEPDGREGLRPLPPRIPPERSEQPKAITEPLLKPSATEPRPSWAGKPDEKPEHEKALATGFSMHVSFAGQWLTVGRTPYRITKPVAEVIGPLVKAQGRPISDGTLRTMLGRAPGPAVHDANLTLKGSPLEIVETPDGYRLVEKAKEAVR